MAGVSQMPMALFVTAPKMSIQAINHKLEQLEFDGVAYLWVVGSTDYGHAPQRRRQGGDNQEAAVCNEGTHPPLPSTFASPFAGQSIPQVAKWLHGAPDHVDLDGRFFGVMDDVSEQDDTVQLCRIGDGQGEGAEGLVQWFPVAARGEFFGHIPAGAFDDDLKGYQGRQHLAGRPDHSSG